MIETIKAFKEVAKGIKVIAFESNGVVSQVQVRVNGRAEHVWFTNSTKEARYKWKIAIAEARELAVA